MTFFTDVQTQFCMAQLPHVLSKLHTCVCNVAHYNIPPDISSYS